MQWEVALQRLFSTFADGWPGLGLLLQRLLTGTILLYCGITHLGKASQFVPITPHVIGAGTGILLLVGLWTPVGGVRNFQAPKCMLLSNLANLSVKKPS